jgi:hypothetical protein
VGDTGEGLLKRVLWTLALVAALGAGLGLGLVLLTLVVWAALYLHGPGHAGLTLLVVEGCLVGIWALLRLPEGGADDHPLVPIRSLDYYLVPRVDDGQEAAREPRVGPADLQPVTVEMVRPPQLGEERDDRVGPAVVPDRVQPDRSGHRAPLLAELEPPIPPRSSWGRQAVR